MLTAYLAKKLTFATPRPYRESRQGGVDELRALPQIGAKWIAPLLTQ